MLLFGLDNELWTVDAITRLTQDGDVIITKSKGKWLTTGDPANFYKAYQEFMSMEENQ